VIITLRYPDPGTDPAVHAILAAVPEVCDSVIEAPAIICERAFPLESVDARVTVTVWVAGTTASQIIRHHVVATPNEHEADASAFAAITSSIARPAFPVPTCVPTRVAAEPPMAPAVSVKAEKAPNAAKIRSPASLVDTPETEGVEDVPEHQYC